MWDIRHALVLLTVWYPSYLYVAMGVMSRAVVPNVLTWLNNGPLNKQVLFARLVVDGGSFNGQENMSFRDLATFLETACRDAIATQLPQRCWNGRGSE